MADNTQLIDVAAGAMMPPDTTIPQDTGGSDEIEIALVDDAPVRAETPDALAETAPRRAQNDPVETAGGEDPLAIERQALAMRERDFLAREERYARELADAHKKRVATERQASQAWLDNLDSQRKVAIEAMKAAKQDGDVAAEVDFQMRLRDIEAARAEILRTQADLPSEAAIDAHLERWRRETMPRPTTPASGVVPGNELASRYVAHNGWLDSPANAEARAYFLSVDQQLSREGYDPRTPAHFEELSRRVAARFPSVGVKMLDGRSVGPAATPLSAPARQSSPPVASARVTAAPPATGTARRNTVQVTDFDRRMIRSMGMDPSDKTVLHRFARERLARERMERR